MDKVTRVESIAVPLPQEAIDTDMILPAQFLLRVDRAGLGQFVFHEARQAALKHGQRFVLDAPDYAGAQIIVGGARFGIGSSREQAVWALHDAGVRAIIAPGFGEIFYANCYNNGIAAVPLSGAAHQAALEAAKRCDSIIVDVEAPVVKIPGQSDAHFEIAEHHRQALLQGLDQTDLILTQDAEAITAFEATHAHAQPWLNLSADQFADFENVGHVSVVEK
ncbi:MAG: 3-isopropylmalate dehydratase small subunit [Pseudomonadota bacterium]